MNIPVWRNDRRRTKPRIEELDHTSRSISMDITNVINQAKQIKVAKRRL
jgi:hypothetical protein